MSDSVIISVENLGKKYRISHQAERQRYTALRDVIAQKMKAPFQFLRKTTRPQTTDDKSPRDHETTRPQDQRDGTTSQQTTDHKTSSPGVPSSSGPSSSPVVPLSRGPVVPSPGRTEDFWALKDVSFEVRTGEVVGIIGPPREIDFHQPTHWTGKCTQFVCRAGHAELPFHRGTNGAACLCRAPACVPPAHREAGGWARQAADRGKARC